MSKRKALVFIVSVFGTFFNAHAFAMDLNFHGFFNATAGRMSNERIRFDDFDTSLSVDNETQFGVQMHMRVQDEINLVGQWVANTSAGDEFALEWAYADLTLSPSQVIRVGKARAPFYRYSESLNVSYSYPWIRPPVESYNLSSSIKINGLQYLLHGSLSQHWDFSSQLYYGGYRGDLQSVPDKSGSRLKEFSGLVVNLENDWALIRAGYHQAMVTSKLDALEADGELYQVLTNTGETALIDDLRLYGKKGRFYGLAVDINVGNWQWLSEMTIVRLQRNLLPTHRGWYSMLAYQWKKNWLLHLTYSTVDSETHYDFTSTNPTNQVIVNEVLRQAETVQHSVLTGFRYELKSGYAIKMEWQRFFLNDNHGNIYRLADGVSDGHADFFNFALNLAF